MLKNVLHKPIKHKLIYMSMIVSGFAIVLICFVFTFYNLFSQRQMMTKEFEMLAKVMGSNVSPFVQFSQKKAAHDVLVALDAKKTVMRVCVYDTLGNLFVGHVPHRLMPNTSAAATDATSARIAPNSALPGTAPAPAEGEPAPPPFTLTDEGRECPNALENGYKFTWRNFIIARPILLKDEEIGSIYIEANLDEIKNYFKFFMIGLASLSIIVLALAYAISSKIQQVISGPIIHLADIATRVKQAGDYSLRAIREYKDETGMLTEAFNTMLAEVEKRDSALQEANETLERKVEIRTRDLMLAKEAAEAADRAKTEFMANMSHELRTPMHGVMSFAEFGCDEALDDSVDRTELKEYFDTIHSSGKRLLKLINNLLDLTKLEAQGGNINVQEADIEAVTRKAIKDMASFAEEKKVHITLMEPEGDISRMTFDPDNITQVITNLLSNAIKFSQEEQTVQVYLRETTMKLEENTVPALSFAMKDQGIGIPEDELEKVFDKFVQSSKTKTGAGGTGLGLPICRSIVQQHKGTIWAENNSDAGCTFTFIIPKQQPVLEKDDDLEAA